MRRVALSPEAALAASLETIRHSLAIRISKGGGGGVPVMLSVAGARAILASNDSVRLTTIREARKKALVEAADMIESSLSDEWTRTEVRDWLMGLAERER